MTNLILYAILECERDEGNFVGKKRKIIMMNITMAKEMNMMTMNARRFDMPLFPCHIMQKNKERSGGRLRS